MRSKTNSPALRTLLAGILVLMTACGGSADPAERVTSGERALGTRDYSAAASDFDAALAALGEDTSNPMFMRAKLGSIEAHGNADPDKAKDDLIALSRAMPGKVTDRDFNRIAGQMGSAKNFDAAIALLTEAKNVYPDSSHLDKLGARLASQAAAAGDAGALSALAGLGYVGE